MNKLSKLLKSDKGDANCMSTVVFIFIAVILLAFMINLFGIISTKQQPDHAADQMVKQIQLSGGINSDTDELFDYLCSQINGAANITYDIDSDYKTPRPSGMQKADRSTEKAAFQQSRRNLHLRPLLCCRHYYAGVLPSAACLGAN